MIWKDECSGQGGTFTETYFLSVTTVMNHVGEVQMDIEIETCEIVVLWGNHTLLPF